MRLNIPQRSRHFLWPCCRGHVKKICWAERYGVGRERVPLDLLFAASNRMKEQCLCCCLNLLLLRPIAVVLPNL